VRFLVLILCNIQYLHLSKGTALQAGRSQVRFPMVSLDFFIDNPSSRTMALGLTASNRNEYQEYFLGVKAAGA